MYNREKPKPSRIIEGVPELVVDELRIKNRTFLIRFMVEQGKLGQILEERCYLKKPVCTYD